MKEKTQKIIGIILSIIGLALLIFFIIYSLKMLSDAPDFIAKYLNGKGENYYKDIYYSIFFSVLFSLIFIIPGIFIIFTKRKLHNTPLICLFIFGLIMVFSWFLENLTRHGDVTIPFYLILIGLPALIGYVISLFVLIFKKS